MQSRFVSSLVLLGSLAFVVVGGCGGDDESASPGGKGGASGSGGSTTPRGGSDNGGEPSMGGEPGVGGEPAANGGFGGEMGSPEPTGSTCQEAADCYAGLDTSELSGTVECIDKVEDGYCTHECEEDSDCCALEGECRTGFKQVCASFENTTVKYCFLSCEDEDLVAAGGASGVAGAGGAIAVDSNEYCEREANPRFTCRSTGGGIENRLVCLPDGGGAGAGGGPNNGPGGAGGAGGASGGAGGASGGAGGASGGAGGDIGGAGGMSGGVGGASGGAGGA